MEAFKDFLALIGILIPTFLAILKFWFENKVMLSVTNITYYFFGDAKSKGGDHLLVNYPTFGFHLYNYGEHPLTISGYEFDSGHFIWSDGFGNNVIPPHEIFELKIPVMPIKNRRIEKFIFGIADGRYSKVPKIWLKSINGFLSMPFPDDVSETKV
jgi:hypothetical protein